MTIRNRILALKRKRLNRSTSEVPTQTTPPPMSLTVMPQVVARFTQERPGVSIALQTRSSARIAEWVAAQNRVTADVLAKLKEAGEVYPAYSTAAEVEERHKAAGRDPKLGYDNYDRDLTDEQIDKARARVEAGEGPSAIARDLGVGRSTLYRALQPHTP